MMALEALRVRGAKGGHHVLDADIRDYFGSIDQVLLMQRVERRITDRRVLKLLRKWLEAGVMDEGRLAETVSGTPQGGVISPLLSNVYLDFLDTVWERQCAGIGKLVRYADDFVVLCPTPKALEEAERRVRIIFDRLKLTLHPEKTRKVNLTDGQEGFDFLGCHLHKRLSGKLLETKGIRRYYLNRWPSAKSMRRVREKIHDFTDRSRNGVKDVRVIIGDLNPVLRGWGNYFCNGNAARKFKQLDEYVYWQLHRFMVRRHGRNLRAGRAAAWTREWLWELGLHRLRGTIRYPKPCMLHEKTTVKPCAGNPHARFERRRVETDR
jgi:group II intron reverse transcriptase/maturase